MNEHVPHNKGRQQNENRTLASGAATSRAAAPYTAGHAPVLPDLSSGLSAVERDLADICRTVGCDEAAEVAWYCVRCAIVRYRSHTHRPTPERWQSELLPTRTRRSVGRPARASERDELGRKRCSTCEEWLPVDAFTVHAKASDGLRGSCAPCVRVLSVVSRFKMSAADYRQKLADQNGVCAVCSQPPEDGKALGVDHDHACCPANARSCGRCVRGLLCTRCNLLLGYAKDSADRLRVAASYLDSYTAAPKLEAA